MRRVSLGATLSVLVLDSFPNGSDSHVTTAPPYDAQYTAAAASRRVGYGLTAQVAITERFTVSGSFLMRRVGYRKNTDIIQGIDNPLTAVDERTTIVTNEDTRARFYDIPVTVRFFNRSRHVSGPRVFVEGGAALRRVNHIKTAIDKTVNSGDTKCCDNTPANPVNRTIRGLVAGAGFQLIDGIGIRVVPEFRYTRWVSDMFKAPAIQMQRNQIEGLISLTF